MSGEEISYSWGLVAGPDEVVKELEALRIADDRVHPTWNAHSGPFRSQLPDVLARALRAREPELHEHSVDVGRLATAVALRLGCPERVVADIFRGAELHDIGKLAISEAILGKSSSLDGREWDVVRRHTVLGEQLLAGIASLAPAARLVRLSHERWDGAGYPDGLTGLQIPLGARVIAACDAYNAMIRDRPYRGAIGHAEAVTELRRCAGSQFDPEVVEALLAEIEAPRARSGRNVPRPRGTPYD